MVQSGTILDGRYRVGRILGKGGMGMVVEATHLQLGTHVAIKILRADRADAESNARFLREARSAAQLRGEHICRVHDFGTLDDGAPYMVMELLQGNDLAVILDRGPLDPTLASSYVLQACMGLAEAHGLGIIHRDLKPRNLFVVDRPDGTTTLKVLDFGIAKSQAKASFELTETQNVIGSPAYMSPEQLKSSKRVDPRSDIWSLGVVFYQLLTADQPFIGESLTELALAISTEPPPPLPDTVPAELAAVVMKCLEKDPANRYQDVAALAAALEPFAKSTTSVATSLATILTSMAVPAVDGDATAKALPSNLRIPKDPATTLHSASGVIAAVPQRSRLRFAFTIGVVAVVASVATTLVVLAWSSQREDAPSNAPATAPAHVPDAAAPIEIDAAPLIEIDAAPATAIVPDAAAIEPPADAAPAEPKKRRIKKHGKDLRDSRY